MSRSLDEYVARPPSKTGGGASQARYSGTQRALEPMSFVAAARHAWYISRSNRWYRFNAGASGKATSLPPA